jgi:predicted DNA-binding transcriptional regulator YafY
MNTALLLDMARKIASATSDVTFTEDELFLIYRALQALGDNTYDYEGWYDDYELSEDTQTLLKKIEKVSEKFSAELKKEILREKYYTFRDNVDERVHATVRKAFENSERLAIGYFNLDSADVTNREIDVYYMNSKYTIAYCHLRKDMRKFRNSRIVTAKPTGKKYKIPKSFNKKDYL